MHPTLRQEIQFSNPGIYHILVQGNVPQEIWESFEGEIDHVSANKDGRVTTSMKIHVQDQAELSGLINLLYDWRLVLLSVKMDGLPEDTGP